MPDLTLDQVRGAGRHAEVWCDDASIHPTVWRTTDGVHFEAGFYENFYLDGSSDFEAIADEGLPPMPVTGWCHIPWCDCKFCRSDENHT